MRRSPQRSFYHKQNLEYSPAPWRYTGAFSRSLERLKLSYVDLYLIHWPVPGCYLSTWKELESILESGRALSIGVSNFDIRHLEELRKISGIIPAVNQIECHPLCYPSELIEYCRAFGIQVQAYAPLARGAYLDNDVMCVLGTKYARTPAQIGLRWAIQKGISVIPKSINPERIRSNGDIFDFNIEDEDMAIIDTLNEDLHTSHVPKISGIFSSEETLQCNRSANNKRISAQVKTMSYALPDILFLQVPTAYYFSQPHRGFT